MAEKKDSAKDKDPKGKAAAGPAGKGRKEPGTELARVPTVPIIADEVRE